MRSASLRRWLGGGAVVSFVAASAVAACSDRDRTSALVEAGVPIVVADVTVYVGSRAALDAAWTDAEELTWIAKTVPPGSAVTTAALAGLTTTRASFIPDVAGDYILEVTARAGERRETKSVKVTATPAPVFFLRAGTTDGGRYVELRAIGNDRSNEHPVACPLVGAGDTTAKFLENTFLFADVAMDWWEAPAGGISRVAFSGIQPADGGAPGSFLALGTSESSCAEPPVLLRGGVLDGGVPAVIAQPRYARDGSRVAFVNQLPTGYVVETVRHDGVDRRKLGVFCAGGKDPCFGFSGAPARPQWVDANTVGWARERSVDGGADPDWEVVVTDDTDAAAPRVYMHCSGHVPRTIAFLRDGNIVANSTNVFGVGNLVLYRPSGPGGVCQQVRNFTNLETFFSYARDFAVSPDETEIAFLRRGALAGEPGPDGGEPSYGGMLYVVPINGGTASAFGGSAEYALFGPRYVASASQLSWNGLLLPPGGSAANPADGGVGIVKLAERDGRQIRTIVSPRTDGGDYVLGGGNGGSIEVKCTLGVPRRSGGAALCVSAFALAAGLLRRRRPHSKSAAPRPRL